VLTQSGVQAGFGNESVRRPSSSCASINKLPRTSALVPGAKVTSKLTSLLSVRWVSINGCMGMGLAMQWSCMDGMFMNRRVR